MDFVAKKVGKFNLISKKNKVLDKNLVEEIYKKFRKNNFAINCENVESFMDYSTIDLIYSLNIPLIIGAPHLISQASILGQDKFPKVYINDFDFVNDKRMLVKRRFKVV